jgi:hypothetical protein
MESSRHSGFLLNDFERILNGADILAAVDVFALV